MIAADIGRSWEQLDLQLGAQQMSTSGQLVPGLVVRHTVFEPSCEKVSADVPDLNVLVVHNSAPVGFQYWSGDRDADRVVLPGRVLPGQVVVVPANQVKARAWDQRTDDVQIGFPKGSPYLGDPGASLRLIAGRHDPLLVQLGRHLARTFEDPAPPDLLYIDALAHAVGAHLIRHYSDDRPAVPPPPGRLSHRQLDEVCDYIDTHLHLPLTVTGLATIAGVSPTHFTRLFREHTGVPPHRHVRLRRLDRAERLIVGTRMPLAQIATTVGFADQSHLNRVMRAERGATPSQLRRTDC